MPFAASARLLAATLLFGVVPGWLLTEPLARRLARSERWVVGTVTGLVATGLFHYLWNVHVAAIAGAPGTTVALIGWCALTSCGALGCMGWARRAPAASDRDAPLVADARLDVGWTLALFLLPVAASLPFATPNGRVGESVVSFDLDEFTHLNLVASMLRAGPPTANSLAGFPMPPYQFLVPSLSAAYVRVTAVDPILLHCRWLVILTLGLATSAAFVLARRLLETRRAAVIAALTLCFAGDAFTTWGFVTEIHSAVAYASLVVALTLLAIVWQPRDAGQSGLARRRGVADASALLLAGLLIASLFQSRAPLFFTCGGALGLVAIERTLLRRDLRAWLAVATALMWGVALGGGAGGSIRDSPLGLGPGANGAALLAHLPAPFDLLGQSRWLGLGVGVVAVIGGVANLRLVGLPTLIRAVRSGGRPGPVALFLATAVALGLGAANVVYERGNAGGIAPLWFVQHPLLLASQLAAGMAIDAWIARARQAAGARRRTLVAAFSCVALTALVTLSLGAGEDPQTFERVERDCGEWLRAHTAVDDAVLHHPRRTGLPMFALRASVLSLEPILEGSKLNGLAPESYMNLLRREVAERRAALDRFFTTSDPAVAVDVARRYRARYLFLGPGETLAFSADSAFGAPATRCGVGGTIHPLPE